MDLPNISWTEFWKRSNWISLYATVLSIKIINIILWFINDGFRISQTIKKRLDPTISKAIQFLPFCQFIYLGISHLFTGRPEENNMEKHRLVGNAADRPVNYNRYLFTTKTTWNPRRTNPNNLSFQLVSSKQQFSSAQFWQLCLSCTDKW